MHAQMGFIVEMSVGRTTSGDDIEASSFSGGCIDKFVSRGERGRSVTSVESNQNLQHVYRVMQPQARAKQGSWGRISIVWIDGRCLSSCSSRRDKTALGRLLRHPHPDAGCTLVDHVPSPCRPLCFSRWTGILVRSFVITRLFYIENRIEKAFVLASSDWFTR